MKPWSMAALAAWLEGSRSVSIALLAGALGADSQDVLFSGQHSISPLVAETPPWARSCLLLAAKAVAYRR